MVIYYPILSLVGYYQHLIKEHVNFNQFLKFYALFLDGKGKWHYHASKGQWPWDGEEVRNIFVS
jgi:hypothetical protein